MRYLHERTLVMRSEEIFKLCELVNVPDGERVVYTLQLLSRDGDTHFAVYRCEGAKILIDPSEIFAHQLNVMSLSELAKIQCPRLASLACAIEAVNAPEVDIHGTQFVIADWCKSISVKRKKTEAGETIGFSFERSEDHNYYLSCYPEQRLTTAIGGKIIDEIVEEVDIKFIRDKSGVLVDWAYKVLGY